MNRRSALVGALFVFTVACGNSDEQSDSPTPTADGGTNCSADDFAWGQGGDLMLPGTACLECHSSSGAAASAVYTAAGTVFEGPQCPQGLAGVKVVITDANSQQIELVTNAVGNFCTAEPLTAPLQTWLELNGTKIPMQSNASGECAFCHSLSSSTGLIWAGP